MSNIIDIADLDVIYLSYDEPQKEEFWVQVKNMVPWAQRVDGVLGSDQAHKAAGELSETERFVLIDGDTLPEEDFFNIQLDFTDKDPNYQQAQFRWKSINAINGLRYGNGGMSSWTKTYVENMTTHEHTDGSEATQVDFMMNSADSLYWAMYDCYSTTYPNKSAFQAWRAGFREGVKMVLDRGALVTVDEFKGRVADKNLNNLTIWQNVGLDAENGAWAIYGARLGTYMTMLTDFEHTDIQWFDNYPNMWEQHMNNDPIEAAKEIGVELNAKLGLPMNMLDEEQSKFFKRRYNADKRNLGPLVTEMEIIREIEGW